MKKTLSYFTILTIALTMISCEQENTSVLANGAWSFVEITADVDDPAVELLLEGIELIFAGSTIEFRDDGSFLVEYSEEGDPVTGTWTLLLETNLTLKFDSGDYAIINGSIQTLTDNSLVYTQKLPYDLSNPLEMVTLTTSWSR